MKRFMILAVAGLMVTGLAFASQTVEEVGKDVYYAAQAAVENGTATAGQLELIKSMQDAPNTVLRPSGASRNMGGPDGFGYTYKDSQEPDGPTYNWITHTGAAMEVAATYGLGDDDFVGPFSIDFGFPFYGATQNQFWIQSNGVISFFGTYVSLSNQNMPSASYGSMIAWFWDDLDPADGVDGQVWIEHMMVDGQNALVISNLDYDVYPNGGTQLNIDAQTILFQDGTIRIQYMAIDAGLYTAGCTIGIQQNGTNGLAALYNGSYANYPFDGLAIQFEMADPDASADGYVYDNDTMAAISGATVDFGGNILTTDGSGYWSATDLYSGTTSYSVTSAGYYATSGTVDVLPGTNSFDFYLDPLPAPISDNYFTDFEADQGVFAPYIPGVWEYGVPTTPVPAYSGTHAWDTVIDGSYPNNAWEWLMSVTTFEIPAGGATASYWHYFDLESGWDGYMFAASVDGVNFDIVLPDGGYNDPDGVWSTNGLPCWSMNSGSWMQATYDLSAYAGQAVWLAFILASDGSVTYPGVTMDDFSFSLGGGTPDFELTLNPMNTQVPGSGGNVTYTATVSNNTGAMAQTSAWTMVTLPNGNLYGPTMQANVNLPPGTITTGTRAQAVPGFAPNGNYIFHGYLGTFGGDVLAEDSFPFSKGPATASIGNPVNNWNATPWVINGESGSTVALPDKFEMTQVYPNPFNPTANVHISLPETAELTVAVFNVAGQQVAELASGKFNAGKHTFTIDGSNLSSGIYFVQANVPGELHAIQKVTLMK